MGSYHLWDYDWTPLSQNPCWNHTTILSLRVALRISCKNTSIVRLKASKLYGTEWNGSVIAIVCRRLKVKEGLYEYELACSSESLRFSLSFWLKFFLIIFPADIGGVDLRVVAGVWEELVLGGRWRIWGRMTNFGANCRIFDELPNFCRIFGRRFSAISTWCLVLVFVLVFVNDEVIDVALGVWSWGLRAWA